MSIRHFERKRSRPYCSRKPRIRATLRRRLAAAIHLLHAAYRALLGRSFGKRASAAAKSLAESGVSVEVPDLDRGIAGEIRKFTNRGPEFEEFDPTGPGKTDPVVKLLAFYLPQFHEIPENNEWWGRGFTEWANLSRGVPRFTGHYQPRIPRDLGHYNLTDPRVLARQVDYAVAAGIYGFCFYYYRFGGRGLLEKPLCLFRDRSDLDMNFCLMWANGNWTKAWDHTDQDILLEQDYDDDDSVAFADDLNGYFQDNRYVRINGRPLFFVFKPAVIPDARNRIENLREIFHRRHREDPLIFMAQVGSTDPVEFGLDGAIEFPPNKFGFNLPKINDRLTPLDHGFSGKVVSYDEMVRGFLDETVPEFPLIKTVCPGWDNDARRQGRGFTVHGASPAKYENWLRACVRHALNNPVYGESLVAINAWNEWAEAAYLEPDVHYGAAYLNATARAVREG